MRRRRHDPYPLQDAWEQKYREEYMKIMNPSSYDYTPLLPKDLLKGASKLSKEEARKIIDEELAKPRSVSLKQGFVTNVSISNQVMQPGPWSGLMQAGGSPSGGVLSGSVTYTASTSPFINYT